MSYDKHPIAYVDRLAKGILRCASNSDPGLVLDMESSPAYGKNPDCVVLYLGRIMAQQIHNIP